MPDELPPPFVPYTVTVAGAPYLVLEPQQADAHRVQTAAGAVLGLACADSSAVLTPETLAALLASPQTVTPGARRQDTRVILDRLTEAEAAALTACTVPGIRLLVLKAAATGAIRDDDPDFLAAVAGLNALGIIAASRWDALFAP